MSARRSPVERDARQLAADALRDGRKEADEGLDVAWTGTYGAFQVAKRELKDKTVWAVQRGDMPRARRAARAVELLEQSQRRMMSRRRRAHQAKMIGLGLEAGVAVQVTAGGDAGTVVTLEEVPSYAWARGTTDDGRPWAGSWRDLEVLPRGAALTPLPRLDLNARPSLRLA